MKDGIKMKKYKVTIEFEVEDNPNFNLEARIEGQGKELTEQDIIQGFMDPEWIHPTCKLEEVK